MTVRPSSTREKNKVKNEVKNERRIDCRPLQAYRGQHDDLT